MSRLRISGILFLLALVLGGRPARAAVSFLHVLSIYEDDKKQPLKDVEGVACGEGGLLRVADTGNGRILSYRVAVKQVTGGQEWRFPELPYPTRLQLDRKGNLLVLDRKLARIGRVSAQGAFQGYLELKGEKAPAGVVPGGLALDGADNAYVLDLASRKVLVADGQGTVLRLLDLPGGSAFFTDVAVDPAGAIYAIDVVGPSVWVADRTATSFTPLVKGLRDTATFPSHAAVSGGRLFLVDQYGHGVIALGLDGSFQGRFLSMGRGEGAVDYPSALCLTEEGTAFLADRGNHRVQVFTVTR